jgi:DNA-binding HxlR family transcriptional regulator
VRSGKRTKASCRAEIRRYDDACGTAHALELVGDRWALLIMRELMLGGRRFSQLRADLPGISATVLTQRLGELEERGIVVRRTLPAPASVQVYELTPWGYEAEPFIREMGRWAARSPLHDPTLRISGVSVLLSLRTMFVRERARGLDAMLGFRFGEDVYRARLTAEGIALDRGEPAGADLVFDGEPTALVAAIYGGVSYDELEAKGSLRVTGDRALARRLKTLFQLPPKLPG